MKVEEFEVTQDHIDRGTCCTSWSCAIALAANEYLDTNSIRAYPNFIRIGEYRYMTDTALELWINQFDRNKDLVSPVTVALFDYGEEHYAGIKE